VSGVYYPSLGFLSSAPFSLFFSYKEGPGPSASAGIVWSLGFVIWGTMIEV
jgi:hypothetical protein